MDANNSIAICFPMGAKGHIAGRLLASCDNVSWYDYNRNGNNPWEPYSNDRPNFTLFHFNRRFAGAVGNGICDKTVPPVLDMAEKNTYKKQSYQDIVEWKQKLFPNNLLYPLHSDLDKAHNFFINSKFLVILPTDIDALVDRFMQTSANYFVNSKNKTYTFLDHYGDANNVKTALENKIQNFKDNILETDIVINSVDELFDYNFFEDICNKLDIQINYNHYKKVKQFVTSQSCIQQ